MQQMATIDLKNRAICVTDAMSATVITGPEKIKSGFGNGDCLLLAPQSGLFAVADASERYPQASRILLEGLLRILHHRPDSHCPEFLQESIAQAYTTQKYNHKTTLSGVSASPGESTVTLHLFHGGDSMVMVAHGKTGRILARTRPDMNFAGRSRQGPAVTSHAVAAGTPLRVFLATDGFGEILRTMPEADATHLPRELIRPPLHDMGRTLRRHIASDPNRDRHDDIGVIVFDPETMDRIPGQTLIMGGTTPGQEATFASSTQRPGPHLAAAQWQDQSEALETAGIHLWPDPNQTEPLQETAPWN